MYRNLKNKNIIITGGSGFLGSQMIKGFLKNKSKLIILDLNKPKIKSKNLVYFNCDITNEIEVKRVLNKIKKKIKIDVLINNAARDYIPQKKK